VPEQLGLAPSESDGIVPLGRPIDNTGVYLLDDALTPVADGESGEICVTGPRLASEYRGQPALTAERFVTPREGEFARIRLYRTHDRGRRRSDGVLEYLGRLDAQFKIRGHRVSSAEVEHAIMAHPDVSEAVVGTELDHAGESVLAAWVVPSEVRSPTVGGRHRYRLPNNLAVAHCNRHETDFGYQTIFEEQTYLKYGITFRDGDCIFDVGSNIGLFALFASLICASPSLFCFEPNPDVFPILELNTRLYGINARLFPFGLSDAEKIGRFTAFSGSTIQSGFYADAESEREIMRSVFRNQASDGRAGMEELLSVRDELIARRFSSRQMSLSLRTLSSVIEEYRVDTIDLLKVNVEKSELDVLHGIREEDWKKIGQVVIKSDVSSQLDAILALLKGKGFETAVDQDELMRHTPVRTLYGIRPWDSRRLQPALTARAHRRPIPNLDEPFITERSLRETLRANLPSYMIPTRFHLLEQLPRNPAGKLDLLALKRESAAPGEHPEPAEPAETFTSTEKVLTAEWCDLLGVDHAGLDDDFFDSGGDSLRGVELLAKVRGMFNVAVSLRDFLRQPTIAGLRQIIEEGGASGSRHVSTAAQSDLPERLQNLDDGF
jgi:FkbM family methyltransferase